MTSKDKRQVSENNLYDKSPYKLGPKTDFTEWLKRLKTLVGEEQVKSNDKWMKEWTCDRKLAQKAKIDADTVQEPYKFPHKWVTFLTEEPLRPEDLSRFIGQKYDQEYERIVAKYRTWWSAFLPSTFILQLQHDIEHYKVHEIVEKLRVTYGNNTGVSLVTKIMSSIRFSTREFKNVKQFLASDATK